MRYLMRDTTVNFGPVIVTGDELERYDSEHEGHTIEAEAILDMHDQVKPNYYMLPQGLDIYDLLSPEEKIGFCKGNALKYIIRAGKKPDNPASKDLKKAIDNLTKWIDELKIGGGQ